MTTLLLTFVAMLVLVGAMAVGVLFGRKPISGSCGGMKALGLDMECEICGGDPDRCESSDAVSVPEHLLAVDAARQRRED